MGQPLKVLLVEDVAADAELIQHHLSREGYDCRIHRVDSEPDFRHGIVEFQPEVILSDFSMPHFDGMAALTIARKLESEVPFIFVSATIGEDVAVRAMKNGANDYVMKANLLRLGAAVRRELQEFETRQGRRLAETALVASEAKYRNLIEQASDGIFVTDSEDRFKLVNARFCAMLGYGEDELMRSQSIITWPEEYRDQVEARQSLLREHRIDLSERVVVRKDGTRFPAEISARLLDNGDTQGIVRDVTVRVRLENALREREAGLRRAQLMARLAHVITADEGVFESWSDTLPQLIGVVPSAMPASTREWLSMIHPDDRAAFRGTALKAAAKGARVDVPYRLRRADGSWIDVEQVIEPLPAETGSSQPMRWFSTLQDVTEQKRIERKIQRLNRVYSVLSGINALIVRSTDRTELFRESCHIAVTAGGFRMAWLGTVDRPAMRVKPVAAHGTGQDYIALLSLEVSETSRELVSHVVQEREVVVVNDIDGDPRMSLREESLERGFHALALLPLVVAGEVVGVFALLSPEAGFFDDEEMRLLRELASDISFALDHIDKAERLHYLAYFDAQTGLANRTLFHERLIGRLQACNRENGKLALVVMNVDRFRNINDSLGRGAGDELLKEIAARSVRSVQDPELLARFVADQFAFVIPNVDTEDNVARTLERINRELFGASYQLTHRELRVVAKYGIAVFPNDGSDADTLLRNAEEALKRAKGAGDRYLFYTQQMTERVTEQLALETLLRQAQERDEFVLYYQCKVDVDTRRIVGAEALIRWQSPDLGLVPPLRFIALLEATGMIVDVGEWALRRAIHDHQQWERAGLETPPVAVNVSAVQLRRKNFVDIVREMVGSGNTNFAIDIELTESVLLENVEATVQTLRDIRDMGVNISIDDFGTGYSSLGYLAKLPVHSLKIDRSFIVAMEDDPDTLMLVSTIISLAHSLRLTVVAEGVETEEQARILRELRCDEMQGYLISRPLPEKDFRALLKPVRA